jgi:FkbM family methyltransferase
MRDDFLVRSMQSFNRYNMAARRRLVKILVTAGLTRYFLNKYYNKLNFNSKYQFYSKYAKIFRRNGTVAPGIWTVLFADRTIKMPMRPSWSWLDWDHAVSIVGNDITIKQTYEALVSSDERPSLFMDVGANYGTHSVLFLAVGIPIIAFEPNPECVSHFDEICQLNGLNGRWEQVAVGNKEGTINLVYPENDTWLGSVSLVVQSTLTTFPKLITHAVSLKKLDEYLLDISQYDKVLIKIDVEGFEYDVIRGALRVLESCKPKIIFESNDPDSRKKIYELLSDSGYGIYELPWKPKDMMMMLDDDKFTISKATNFLAVTRAVDHLDRHRESA